MAEMPLAELKEARDALGDFQSVPPFVAVLDRLIAIEERAATWPSPIELVNNAIIASTSPGISFLAFSSNVGACFLAIANSLILAATLRELRLRDALEKAARLAHSGMDSPLTFEECGACKEVRDLLAAAAPGPEDVAKALDWLVAAHRSRQIGDVHAKVDAALRILRGTK